MGMSAIAQSGQEKTGKDLIFKTVPKDELENKELEK